MARYLLRRLLLTVPVIFVTSVVVFAAMRILPGDPVLLIAGEAQGGLSPEVLARIRADNDLDQPLPVQYVRWAGKMLTGDFGRSIRSRQPVLDILLPRL